VRKDALAKLDGAHAAIVDAFGAMPDPALAWLKPGDDYAIGGVAIHLIQSLDGYIATLAALDAAGYTDTSGPGEDERVVEAQLAHMRRGVSAAERAATFAEMRTKHERFAALARKPTDAQFDALIGVTYPTDEVPYPTSVALVVQWMTDHYVEHVPHVQTLFSEWKMAADARR
jgi:hypothetical protein